MTKLLAIVLSFGTLGLAACSRESSSTSPPAPRAQPAQPAATASLPAGLIRVADASEVCMVTNQYMGSPQIPIDVDGRTYYGCCAMCKDRLDKEPATRTAADPVTGEAVDKATAVIVKNPQGKLLYFASEDTLRRYRG